MELVLPVAQEAAVGRAAAPPPLEALGLVDRGTLEVRVARPALWRIDAAAVVVVLAVLAVTARPVREAQPEPG